MAERMTGSGSKTFLSILLRVTTGFVTVIGSSAWAVKYINQDAEALTCGANIPSSVWDAGGDENPTLATGHVVCGGAPQGGKYFEWTTSVGQRTAGNSTFTNPRSTGNMLGKTVYVALYVNFTRINGVDVWPVQADGDSGDKGTELQGSGIRWDIGQGFGTWGNTRAQLHKWTAWQSNPSWHLNPTIEKYDAIPNNQSGYGAFNSVQLDYEKWYAFVHKVTISNTTTGAAALWVNGKKISEYNGIITAGNATPTIEYIGIGGTMCQPAYNCPPHHRRYDAVLVTDSWQDVIDGGYMNGVTPLSAPRGLHIP